MRPVWFLVAVLLASMLAGCLGSDDSPRATNEDEPVWSGGFSTNPVPAGTYDMEDAYSKVLTPGPYDVGVTEVVYLDSDADGAKIQIGIVRPDVPEGEQVGVIVIASPYFSPLQTVELADYYKRLTHNFVPHGFAVAFLAVRGTADSGGCSDLFGPLEKADLDQGITWLGERPWSNGNVGMIGVSYDGSTPWIVASTGNPYLKTIVPISGLSDVFDLEYRNGTVEQRMLGLVTALYWFYGFVFNEPLNGRAPERTVEGVVCPAAFMGTAASVGSGVTGERAPFAYWDERNHRPGVEENYEGSILLIHGLQDWNVDPHHAYPWVNELEASGITVKHWLGQWAHAWPDTSRNADGTLRWDYAQKMLQWFDYYLNENMSADLGPRAEVQDSSGQWRFDETWPPANTSTLKLYLAPDDRLVEEMPDTSDVKLMGSDGSLVDGAPMMGGAIGDLVCALCLVFESGPLQDGLRFAGLPRVHVEVFPSAPTGHVSAFLYIKHGSESSATYERVGWTQMNIRFHAGGEEAHTVVPGAPINLKMQMEPLDVVVPEGARLVLVLSEGTQHDRSPTNPFAPMRVAAGPMSVMKLDTFGVEDAALFKVP